MSKKKHPSKFKSALIITALAILSILISLCIYTNILIRSDASQRKIQNGKFTYTLLPQNEQILSGKSADLVIQVKNDGIPAIDRKFMAGLTHTSGIFIDDRTEDIGTFKEYTPNSKGEITVPFSPKFKYWNYDRGFGLGIYPILSAEEKDQHEQPAGTGVVVTPTNDAATFSLTVYPYWLNWLIVRL